MTLDEPNKSSVVLDPDLTYIYVPENDFNHLNEELTRIMTNDSQGHDVSPYLYPCQKDNGACVFQTSCQEAQTYMLDTGKELTASFTMDDQQGTTYDLSGFSSQPNYFITGTTFGFT